MNDAFVNWLKDAEKNTCVIKDERIAYRFIKVRANADYDYLYYQGPDYKQLPSHREHFIYAGILRRKDGVLYDTKYEIAFLAGQDERSRCGHQLRQNLSHDVQQLVETTIANDRRNLRVTKLSDPELLHRKERHREYVAKARARLRFLNNKDFTPPTFQCEYEAENWTDAALLAYISDPEGYAAREAANYMETHQEEMLFNFLCNDLELAEYQALIDDTENPVHFVKKIRAAMIATPAKTANVTIRKDGEEFSFKTEAQELRSDTRNYYGSWYIVPADRQKFEARYGRYTNYYPQEIVRITYDKKVLYEVGK